mmetsp:Transcript_44550/g.102971  ORF Transcript_44550/g.102971 Transcript_44550/m.102971 type:complete len:405 (-) Transcript_44550:265-1479(-)
MQSEYSDARARLTSCRAGTEITIPACPVGRGYYASLTSFLAEKLMIPWLQTGTLDSSQLPPAGGSDRSRPYGEPGRGGRGSGGRGGQSWRSGRGHPTGRGTGGPSAHQHTTDQTADPPKILKVFCVTDHTESLAALWEFHADATLLPGCLFQPFHKTPIWASKFGVPGISLALSPPLAMRAGLCTESIDSDTLARQLGLVALTGAFLSNVTALAELKEYHGLDHLSKNASARLGQLGGLPSLGRERGGGLSGKLYIRLPAPPGTTNLSTWFWETRVAFALFNNQIKKSKAPIENAIPFECSAVGFDPGTARNSGPMDPELATEIITREWCKTDFTACYTKDYPLCAKQGCHFGHAHPLRIKALLGADLHRSSEVIAWLKATPADARPRPPAHGTSGPQKKRRAH